MEALIPMPWYRRRGWFIVMLLALLLLVFGLYVQAAPVESADFMRETDLEWTTFSSEFPEVAAYLEREARLLGATAIGLGGLVAALAATLVRRGSRPAWLIVWFLPATLALYALVFLASGAAVLTVTYVLGTALAVAATWVARPAG